MKRTRSQRAAPQRARNADEKRYGAWAQEPATHPDHSLMNPKPYSQFQRAWNKAYLFRQFHASTLPKPCGSPSQAGITNLRRWALGIPIYPTDMARHLEHCSYCQACCRLYRDGVLRLNPEWVPAERLPEKDHLE